MFTGVSTGGTESWVGHHGDVPKKLVATDDWWRLMGEMPHRKQPRNKFRWEIYEHLQCCWQLALCWRVSIRVSHSFFHSEESWNNQWIGLVENLPENPTFNGKTPWVSGYNFPVKTNPLKQGMPSFTFSDSFSLTAKHSATRKGV